METFSVSWNSIRQNPVPIVQAGWKSKGCCIYREKGFASSWLMTCIEYTLEVSWGEACIPLESRSSPSRSFTKLAWRWL